MKTFLGLMIAVNAVVSLTMGIILCCLSPAAAGGPAAGVVLTISGVLATVAIVAAVAD